MSKKNKCTLCISGLKNNNPEINTNKSELVEMKTRGFLTHPSGNMYNILQVLEASFQKHCSSPDVFENTYNEFLLASTNLKFPCENHKTDVMVEIFTSYICMRMRQYTYMENQKSKKLNRTKKKLSKLVSC